ncbi:MAG: lysozyme [Bacteroidales bacterium]|nr:lysozyme [Bacteroidales bacterium]
MKITKVSGNCIKLIEHYECSGDVGRYLTAYKCPAGVWTIGIGTTVYPNGTKVKPGDKCTVEQAFEYLRHDLTQAEEDVCQAAKVQLTQQQFDALVSFTYNLGGLSLKGSTLLKKVNANPNDPTIEAEFNKWVYANKVKLPGLVKRRKAEAWLYFHGINNFNF